MATLKLNIDALKFPEPEDANVGGKVGKNKMRSRLVSKIKPQSTFSTVPTLENISVPKGHLPEQWGVFQILEDFLQPGSASSLQEAANHAIEIFVRAGWDYANMRALNVVCTELAEQIPYNHPSQLKLARFLWVVGRSHRQFKGARTEVLTFCGFCSTAF